MNRWVEAYRDLLDRWHLFGRRVEFDVWRQKIGSDLDGGEREYGQMPLGGSGAGVGTGTGAGSGKTGKECPV